MEIKEDCFTICWPIISNHFIKQISIDLKGIEGAANKLRKLILTHIYLYDHNRVFAKISAPRSSHFIRNDFASETYRTVKVYTQMILELYRGGR